MSKTTKPDKSLDTLIQIKEFLEKYGCKFKETDWQENRSQPVYYITGKGVKGYLRLYDPNEKDWWANSALILDNKKSFNKISDCPMVIQPPIAEKELYRQLKILRSEVGLNISNKFLFWDKDYDGTIRYDRVLNNGK